MLASIRGTVIEKTNFTAVIDCSGFGVEVLLTRAAAELCRPNASVFLYTFLQFSDAGISLYGFADDVERRTFRLMILTKGVGGKMAISVLQHLSPSEIVTAVEGNDAGLFTAVPGIGRKTAERICFELADRIHKNGFGQIVGGFSAGEKSGGSSPSGVLDALESLGFDRVSALRAYKTVIAEQGEELGESDAIMSALRLLQPRK